MTDKVWRSYHLYRPEPWEALLTEAVAPFVRASFEEHVADSFFFVRYWERGPHIRLRLRTTVPEELDRRVDAHFSEFFTRYPSTRPAAGEGWLPNDSVQRIDYEPETERYGGPERLPLAEEQFEASSRGVLAILREGAWTYERALGAAIQLHLVLLHAFRFDLGAAARYFASHADAWLSTPESTLRSFAAAFERQRDQLTRTHTAVWSALEENVDFEQEWANRWRADMTSLAMRFRGARRNLDAKESAILSSFIHMTNNRLGVRNRDETFLMYLIIRSLENVHESIV